VLLYERKPKMLRIIVTKMHIKSKCYDVFEPYFYSGVPLTTFRRKIEALGCCGRIAQGMENCKVGQI
jgi:hypothetical protein